MKDLGLRGLVAGRWTLPVLAAPPLLAMPAPFISCQGGGAKLQEGSTGHAGGGPELIMMVWGRSSPVAGQPGPAVKCGRGHVTKA